MPRDHTTTEDIVIVGAGPAGCSAAVQCMRLGIRPLLLEQSGEVGGLIMNAWCVENYPGLEPMPGPAVARLLEAHLTRFGMRVTPAKVQGLAPTQEGFSLHTDRGERRARAVILALGTIPRPLRLEDGRIHAGLEVYYEVRKLLDAWPTPRRVIVLGGGEAAVDYSLSLARAGAKVELLVRGDALKARGRLKAQLEATSSIEIRYQAHLVTVTGRERSQVLEFQDGNGRFQRQPELLLAAIGRKTAPLDLVSGTEIASVHDDTVATSHAGLYIAGDMRLGSLGQLGIAVGDGLRAAMLAVEHLSRQPRTRDRIGTDS